MELKKKIALLILMIILIGLLSCRSSKPGCIYHTNYQYTDKQVIKPVYVYLSDTLILINSTHYHIEYATHKGKDRYYTLSLVTVVFTGNDLYLYDPYQKVLLMVNSLRKLDVENIKEIVEVWHRSMLNNRDMAPYPQTQLSLSKNPTCRLK